MPTHPAMDKERFRRKYMLRLATAPTVFGPVIAGLSTLVAGWSLDLPGLVPFLGLAAAVVGFGTFATKLIAGDETRAREALDELEHEVEEERERELDRLSRRLSSDRDPRDERLLTDLRHLAKEFKNRDFWPADLSSASTFDLMHGVETLFAGCVDSLERQVRLVEIAGNMSTAEARTPLLDERERILDEVAECITQLGKMYSSIQGLRGHGKENAELARVRAELDRSLEVAARVQERMRSWDRERTALET